MGQDITPRNGKGEIADEGNSGVIALYHLVRLTSTFSLSLFLSLSADEGNFWRCCFPFLCSSQLFSPPVFKYHLFLYNFLYIP
jgi:hypothetical protein